MINKVLLEIEDVEKILNIMKRTGSNSCTVIQNNDSGIGSVTDIEVFLKFNGIVGTFRVNIEDETNW